MRDVSHGTQSSAPLVYKAVAIALVLGGAMFFAFRGGPDAPAPVSPNIPFAQPPAPAAEPGPINQDHYRIAVMEAFSGLDTRVVSECVPPLVLNKKWFGSDEQFEAANQFLAAAKKYDSSESLVRFIELMEQINAQPADAVSEDLLAQFRTLPGSDSVLKIRTNPELLYAFQQIANRRLRHLLMVGQSGLLQSLLDRGLLDQMRATGADVTPADGAPSEPHNILRYWEITSTKYLLCQSGNNATTMIVQSLFPGQFQPVYANAPNAVLDPVQRRFQTRSMLDMKMVPEESNRLRILPAPKGPVAMMEFGGAIPRAKLYSDWRMAADEATAQTLVYSRSFNPQIQVILRSSAIPRPQRPAATEQLPPVKIQELSGQQGVLTVPPLQHNSVLLLTNSHQAGWQAKVNGTAIPVVRANLDSCAIHLPPAKAERRVEYTRP